MAKKKAAKKRAAKKRAGGAAAGAPEAQAGSCTEQELQTAALVAAGGELIRFAQACFTVLEARGIDVAEVLHTALGNLQREPEREGVSGEQNGNRGWNRARRLIELHDFHDKPYLRVFGRVMQILLNHRGFQTCTAGDVFRVFLVEIPDQLEENHRQTPRTGQQVSVSTGVGRRTFNNRMERMRREELARPTVARESGRDEAYVLTEDGQALFDGWPDLAHIPGLTYEGPATPEPRPRRRS